MEAIWVDMTGEKLKISQKKKKKIGIPECLELHLGNKYTFILAQWKIL